MGTLQEKEADGRPLSSLSRAAELIEAADFLLIAAGAGFSADSGLPTYSHISLLPQYEERGIEYADLCDPHLLDEDAGLFYGFWGDCEELYRQCASHRGYEVLKKWKERKEENEGERELIRKVGEKEKERLADGLVPSSSSLFVYTSNVDGHFSRYFASEVIYEIHGSMQTWQCSGYMPDSEDRGMPCSLEPQALPSNYSFCIEREREKEKKAAKPFPLCRFCGSLLRPSVLMFHDKRWRGNKEGEERYVAWEAAVETLMENDPSLRLVILEMGCGLRVPSVRLETEMVCRDVNKIHGKKNCQIIRINSEEREAEIEPELGLSVVGRAEQILLALDKLIAEKDA